MEPIENTPIDEPTDDDVEITYLTELTLTQTELNITSSNSDFVWELFNKNSSGKTENVVVSPLSVTIAMTMMANGAYERSPVRAEILNTLGFPNFSITDVNSTVMKLAEGIGRLDEEVTVDLANSLWVDTQNFALNPEYTSILKKDFYAESHPIVKSTFVADVNSWCSKKTRGLIERVLPDNFTAPLMALINATYFKGLWNKSFAYNANLTKEGTFYCESGSEAKAEYMNSATFYECRKTDTFEMVSIPFGKGNYNFHIIRPNDGNSTGQCLTDVLAGGWNNLITKEPAIDYLDIKLPKFGVEYGSELADILSDMGMNKAMRVTDYYFAYSGGLKIDRLIHKARLRINEEGGEAAAISIVVPNPIAPGGGANIEPPKPRPFYLDHPFIYLISEKSTGTILFIGDVKTR